MKITAGKHARENSGDGARTIVIRKQGGLLGGSGFGGHFCRALFISCALFICRALFVRNAFLLGDAFFVSLHASGFRQSLFLGHPVFLSNAFFLGDTLFFGRSLFGHFRARSFGRSLLIGKPGFFGHAGELGSTFFLSQSRLVRTSSGVGCGTRLFSGLGSRGILGCSFGVLGRTQFSGRSLFICHSFGVLGRTKFSGRSLLISRPFLVSQARLFRGSVGLRNTSLLRGSSGSFSRLFFLVQSFFLRSCRLLVSQTLAGRGRAFFLPLLFRQALGLGLVLGSLALCGLGFLLSQPFRGLGLGLGCRRTVRTQLGILCRGRRGGNQIGLGIRFGRGFCRRGNRLRCWRNRWNDRRSGSRSGSRRWGRLRS